MHLVLCNAGDVAASWAWLQLKKVLRDRIELVTAEALVYALRWEHRVTTTGTSTAVTLADGRTIRFEDARCVLNRLQTIPEIASRAVSTDREYAASEMHALLASALHGLTGRVWNRGNPSGLSGTSWRHPAEWVQLAARAGFATRFDGRPRPQPVPARLLLVAGETVLGPAPPSVKRAALALSGQVDAPLLGVELTRDWIFHAATPHPNLRLGAAPMIDALRRQLFREAA